MDKLKDSLTFLFKEKNWALKMLLPFGLTLLMTLPSIFTNDAQGFSFSTTGGLRNSYNAASGAALVSALISCLVCLLAIPFGIATGWYTYESTQSGIQKRATKALWEGDFGDKLKKSLKYLAASLVYGLVIGLIVGVLAIIFFFALAILTGGAFSVGDLQTTRGLGNISGVYLLLVCLFSFVFIVVVLAIAVLAFLITTPGLLRLVATNTFSEAFKLRDNWDLAMRHKSQFLGLLLVSFAGATLLAIIGGIAGAMAGVFGLVGPVLFTGALFVANYINTLVSTYFSYFFYPRFSGLVFRDVIESDSKLSYIPTKGEVK